MMRLLEASRKKSFLIEEADLYTVIKQRLSLGIKTEICNTANPGLLGCLGIFCLGKLNSLGAF